MDQELEGRIKDLLKQGAPVRAISRITGSYVKIICEYRAAMQYPEPKQSETYPRITEFAERQLRIAAEQRLGPSEAGNLAGISATVAKGFWREINYNYLTDEQEMTFRDAVSVGARTSELVAQVRLKSSADVNYFLKLFDLELQPYVPGNKYAPKSTVKIVFPTT